VYKVVPTVEPSGVTEFCDFAPALGSNGGTGWVPKSALRKLFFLGSNGGTERDPALRRLDAFGSVSNSSQSLVGSRK
jgi:hypothetical protein